MGDYANVVNRLAIFSWPSIPHASHPRLGNEIFSLNGMSASGALLPPALPTAFTPRHHGL
jgi:hypothetical protein